MHLKDKNEPKEQLYSNKRMGQFAKSNPFYIVLLFAALSIFLFIYMFGANDATILLKLLVFSLGVLGFTFVEYAFHRFLYHSGEDFKKEGNWQYLIHGVHHNYPNVKQILAMPILLALGIAAVFFGIFYLIMGIWCFYFFPGFILGYAVYIFIHILIHTQPTPNNFFRYLWKHHHLHHYRYEDKAFGVSSHLWDVVFRTMPPKDNDKKTPRN